MGDAGYPFLSTGPETLAAVISVAMFNRNPRVGDAPLDAPEDPAEYLEGLRAKFRSVLSAASEARCSALVMPDVGCGVYMNDGRTVGRIFGEVLRQEFDGEIKEVV